LGKEQNCPGNTAKTDQNSVLLVVTGLSSLLRIRGNISMGYVRIAKACEILGISQSTIRRYIRSGKIVAGSHFGHFLGSSQLAFNEKHIEAIKKLMSN
jgi:predicted DNA-binding transcriptional regulator AlpA